MVKQNYTYWGLRKFETSKQRTAEHYLNHEIILKHVIAARHWEFINNRKTESYFS